MLKKRTYTKLSANNQDRLDFRLKLQEQSHGGADASLVRKQAKSLSGGNEGLMNLEDADEASVFYDLHFTR
jgi:hypothetical protein